MVSSLIWYTPTSDFYETHNIGQCISRIQMYKKNNEIKLFLEHAQMTAPRSKRLQDLDCKTV